MPETPAPFAPKPIDIYFTDSDPKQYAGLAYESMPVVDYTALANDPGYQSMVLSKETIRKTVPSDEYFNIGDTINGRFEVLAIHKGALGIVYGVYDHEEKLPRALKTLQRRFWSDQKMRTAFEKEVLLWMKLEKHPFIVHALLMEKIEETPYVITEYIRGPEGMGGDLLSWLGHPRLTFDIAVQIALQIAQGMQHATHKVPDLIHHDLKPANILVDSLGRAVITNFGLASIFDKASGTPAYMSPEQWEGKKINSGADIYAYGCILYEMFTGHRLFSAQTIPEWRTAHLSATPVQPHAIKPNVPEAIELLILKCLSKKREDRPATWDEIVSIFAEIVFRLTGQPVILNFTSYDLSMDELIKASYTMGYFNKFEDVLEICNRGLSIDKRRLRRITSQSNHTTLLNNKAVALSHLKRYDEVIVACDRVIEMAPKDSFAWKWKANALEKLNQYDEAIVAYDRLIEIDPKDSFAWKWKINALEKLNQHDEAIVTYDRLIQIDPKNSWAREKKANEQESVLKRYNNAISYKEIANYDRAIEQDPTDSHTWYKKAVALDNLNRYDEAVVAYDRLIEVDPNDGVAWNNKGNALANLKRYDEAISSYDRALEINPQNRFAWKGKAAALERLKRYNEAIVAYDRLIEMDPNNRGLRERKSNSINKLKQYNKAIASLGIANKAIRKSDQAIEIDHNDSHAWHRKAVALEKLERYDEAIAACNRAIEIDPKYLLAWNNKGNVLEKLKRYDEAIAAYNRAIEIDPKYVLSWNNKGVALDKLKRYDEAIAAYDRAIEMNPKYILAWKNKGVALDKLKRHKEAMVAYDRARKIEKLK